MDKRKGESRLSLEDLLSHSFERIPEGSFVCMRQFLVSKNVNGEKGHNNFPSKICCLTVMKKKIVEQPICVSEFFWYRKKLRKRQGASRLSVEGLLSHSTEKFSRGTLCCLEFLWYQTNFIDKRERESRCSVNDLLSHSTEKIRRRNLLCLRKVLVSQNFMDKKREVEKKSITNLHRIFVTTQYGKIGRGSFLCYRKILVLKPVKDKRGGITIYRRCFDVSKYRKSS